MMLQFNMSFKYLNIYAITVGTIQNTQYSQSITTKTRANRQREQHYF